LLKIYPDNSNFCAKLGICCLNLDGKKPEALRLLSIASQNVVKNDKEYLEYGEKAPWIPIFTLLKPFIRMTASKKP